MNQGRQRRVSRMNKKTSRVMYPQRAQSGRVRIKNTTEMGRRGKGHIEARARISRKFDECFTICDPYIRLSPPILRATFIIIHHHSRRHRVSYPCLTFFARVLSSLSSTWKPPPPFGAPRVSAYTAKYAGGTKLEQNKSETHSCWCVPLASPLRGLCLAGRAAR
jgi:hypothetical protein